MAYKRKLVVVGSGRIWYVIEADTRNYVAGPFYEKRRALAEWTRLTRPRR